MRSLSDRYRDLFPAVLGASVQDPTTGAWRHAFAEIQPAGADAYNVQPGARGGTTSTNYALEIMNRRTAPGTLVWMRHRDEQQVIHYEFIGSCCCAVCYSGIDVTGPALLWVDGQGLWEAINLTGQTAALVTQAGTPALSGAVYDGAMLSAYEHYF